jgi:hypothetical protein
MVSIKVVQIVRRVAQVSHPVFSDGDRITLRFRKELNIAAGVDAPCLAEWANVGLFLLRSQRIEPAPLRIQAPLLVSFHVFRSKVHRRTANRLTSWDWSLGNDFQR